MSENTKTNIAYNPNTNQIGIILFEIPSKNQKGTPLPSYRMNIHGIWYSGAVERLTTKQASKLLSMETLWSNPQAPDLKELGLKSNIKLTFKK